LRSNNSAFCHAGHNEPNNNKKLLHS
jgi:hypothetical protein